MRLYIVLCTIASCKIQTYLEYIGTDISDDSRPRLYVLLLCTETELIDALGFAVWCGETCEYFLSESLFHYYEHAVFTLSIYHYHGFFGEGSFIIILLMIMM